MTVAQLQLCLEFLPANLPVVVMDDTDSFREVKAAALKTAFDEGYGPNPDKPLRPHKTVEVSWSWTTEPQDLQCPTVRSRGSPGIWAAVCPGC